MTRMEFIERLLYDTCLESDGDFYLHKVECEKAVANLVHGGPPNRLDAAAFDMLLHEILLELSIAMPNRLKQLQEEHIQDMKAESAIESHQSSMMDPEKEQS